MKFTKTSILEAILNFLLPKSDILRKTDKFMEKDLFPKLSITIPNNVPFAESLFPYTDRDIKDLVWVLKYHRQKSVAKLFGNFLYENILSSIGENIYLTDFDAPVLIPIPISKSRLRERGYNQAEIIVREILIHDSENLCTLQNKVLIKKNAAHHQAHTTSKKERERNIKNSFEIRNTHLIKNNNIILIDDVITTGATVKEARLVLLKAGAKNVRALSIAH